MNTVKQTRSSSPLVALLACAAVSLALTQAAPARGTLETRSEKVSYSDVNLATATGASILYSRIERAAGRVCGPDNVLGQHFEWTRCRSRAIADAVNKVNSPLLTALQESKTGGPRLAALQSSRSRTK
jgi:UrcA family protein